MSDDKIKDLLKKNDKNMTAKPGEYAEILKRIEDTESRSWLPLFSYGSATLVTLGLTLLIWSGSKSGSSANDEDIEQFLANADYWSEDVDTFEDIYFD